MTNTENRPAGRETVGDSAAKRGDSAESRSLLPADLPQLAREQFEQIRAERKALVEEQRKAQENLDRRKQELERQTANLMARLDEIHERERALGDKDASTGVGEVEALRKQVYEREYRLELMQAERDAAWAQVQQTREEWERRLGTLPDDLAAAKEELKQHATECAELSEKVAVLEAECDSLRVKLRQWPTREVEIAIDRVQLDAPPATLSLGQFGLEHTDLSLAEYVLAQGAPANLLSGLAGPAPKTAEVRAAPDAKRELTAERDALNRYEADFTEMRRLLRADNDRLAGAAQDLHRREQALQQRLEQQRQEMVLERERLEHEREALQRQVERQRLQDEGLRRHQLELRLQEAEVQEMREIAENEFAQERAQLAQERVRIARLRGTLRLESGTPSKRPIPPSEPEVKRAQPE